MLSREDIRNIALTMVAVSAAVSLVASVFAWIMLVPFRQTTNNALGWLVDQVQNRGGTVCTVIPDGGHNIFGDAAPETNVTVALRDIDQLRGNCGGPVIFGYVSNGNSIVHNVVTSLDRRGVDLPVGRTEELVFQFTLPDDVVCGRAWFWVDMIFPNAEGGAPPIKSPKVPFFIANSDGAVCHVRDQREP